MAKCNLLLRVALVNVCIIATVMPSSNATTTPSIPRSEQLQSAADEEKRVLTEIMQAIAEKNIDSTASILSERLGISTLSEQELAYVHQHMATLTNLLVDKILTLEQTTKDLGPDHPRQPATEEEEEGVLSRHSEQRPQVTSPTASKSSPFSPAFEILTEDDGAHVYVDTLAFPADAITVNVTETDLVIKAHNSCPPAAHIPLCFNRKFTKRIPLPPNTDVSKIMARRSARDGILDIWLPRHKPREVPVLLSFGTYAVPGMA